MNKETNNRRHRDELDIESLISSLRQDISTPPPQVSEEAEPQREIEQTTEPVKTYRWSDEDLERLRLETLSPMTQESPEPAAWAFQKPDETVPFASQEEDSPSTEESALWGSSSQEREEPLPEDIAPEQPVKEKGNPILNFFRKRRQKNKPSIEKEQQFIPEQEKEPEPEYVPELFTPLQEQAPDIVLRQMQEEDEQADRVRSFENGQVVMLNITRKGNGAAPEEREPKEKETDRVRLDPRTVVQQAKVMPPEPLAPQEPERKETAAGTKTEEPENAPRILTLNLKRRVPQTTTTRVEVFNQDNEEDDAELETLERMLEKHAEESRRRREAEAEQRRIAEEEQRAAREAEEAARLATEKAAAEKAAAEAAAEAEEEPQPAPSDEEEAEQTAAPTVEKREQTTPVQIEREKSEEKQKTEEPSKEPSEDEPENSYDEDGDFIDESLLERPDRGPGLWEKLAERRQKRRAQKAETTVSDAEFEELPESTGLFKKQKKTKPEQEKVIELPTEKPNALQKKLEEINERADEFAESMFQGDNEDSKAEETAQRLAEQYIPATDYEEERAPKKEKAEPKQKEPPRRAPDTSPKELYRKYYSSWKSSLVRLPAQFIAALVLLVITAIAGDEFPFLTVEALSSNPTLSGWILTIGLAIAAALGLDTLLEGVFQLLRGRPGLNTLASIGAILTLVDGLWFCTAGRPGPLPFCGFAALSLWSAAWGSCSKKDGLQRAAGAVAGRSEFERLTMDQGKWGSWGTFAKEQGDTKGFGRQMQEDDGAQRIYRYAAPVMLIACVVFGLLSVVGQKNAEMLVWTWSVIFVLATPLSATLAYGMPYLVSVKRLLRSGAVLAGWEGVESMKGDAGIVLKDRDLFPEGSVQLNGIKSFGQVSLEKLTGCTGSMIREADIGLAKIFDDQIRIQGGFYRRVDDLQYSDAGGCSGLIRGDKVLIGTAGYMKMQGIELEQGQHIKNAVFCVINGQLQGIFALNYNLPRNAEPNLEALINGHVYPVLALRDFNVTPSMLQQRFGLPVDRMQYPDAEKRHELSERNQPHNPVLGALIFREGIGPYTDAILGGRRLRSVVRVNAILSVLGSVVGALLGFYLTMVSAYASLSPMNILFFLIMWLIPTVLISHAADKY